MQWYRIHAILLRHYLPSVRDLLRVFDILYWPVFDIVLWGFTGMWMQGMNPAMAVSTVLLTALVFWQIVMRSNMEISLSLLEELWSQNMINLFSTPLSITEWLVAVCILSVAKSIFALLFGTLIVGLLYGICILQLGWITIPFFILLVLSGWSLGLLASTILMYAGQRAQSMAWIICWFIAPFSGVFYPVSVLPAWAQKISLLLPSTYLFEGLRLLITTGSMPHSFWYTSAGLNLVYCAVAFIFFVHIFHKAKTEGLARVQAD